MSVKDKDDYFKRLPLGAAPIETPQVNLSGVDFFKGKVINIEGCWFVVESIQSGRLVLKPASQQQVNDLMQTATAMKSRLTRPQRRQLERSKRK